MESLSAQSEINVRAQVLRNQFDKDNSICRPLQIVLTIRTEPICEYNVNTIETVYIIVIKLGREWMETASP